MSDKKQNKVVSFAEVIFTSLFGAQNHLTELHFYLTEHCNLKCPGCYMQSSPRVAAKTLPSDDINYFMKIMAKEPVFANSVAFSGGEIFTTDLNYLADNIQNVLNNRFDLEIKTNGAWVNNKKKSDDVFQMLADLKVPKRTGLTQSRLEEFLFSIPNLKTLSKDQINQKINEKFISMPILNMGVSVDDFIHPAASAKWFTKIAKTVTSNPKLSNNLNVKAYSFRRSSNFFIDNVLKKLNLDAYESSAGMCIMTLNNQEVLAHFGDFIDKNQAENPETFSKIMFPSEIDGGQNRLVLFVYPDQTIGFSTDRLKSVGRVPYIDKHGEYKTYGTLRKEMAFKIIDDYVRAISR